MTIENLLKWWHINDYVYKSAYLLTNKNILNYAAVCVWL